MKILIIGQALPKVQQAVPYDTTMLYGWLQGIGISKEAAQELFDFDAMCPFFPGAENGGHKKPSQEDMRQHFKSVLSGKIRAYSKVILLGNVPKEFFQDNASEIDALNPRLAILKLIHPSKRNWSLYQQNKELIHSRLKAFIELDIN